MPIDNFAFRTMTLYEQVYTVVNEGEYLMRRYEEAEGDKVDGVNLYHMGTFFCEVYYDYDYDLNKIVRTRTFTNVKGLEDYTAYIMLPDLG